MTKKEFAQIVLAITTFYPNDKNLNTEASVKLWYEMLKDLEYRDLAVAVQKHVSTSRFSPTVADLREACQTVQNGEIPLWSEGWAELVDAIRYYGYMREIEGLNSLSRITRIVAQRLGWQNLCQSENPMADRANFRITYEQVAEHEKQRMQLAPNVRSLIDRVTAENKGFLEQRRELDGKSKGTGEEAGRQGSLEQ